MTKFKADYEQELKDICTKLDVYLQNRFKYKDTKAYVHDGRIFAGTTKYEIMLRFNSNTKRRTQLVFARLGFKQQRIGHGTDFMKFIVSIAMEYNYPQLKIEYTNKNSLAFGKKMGFRKYRRHMYLKTEFFIVKM